MIEKLVKGVIFDRKIQAICCGILITVVGLGVLVSPVVAQSGRADWNIETVDSTGYVGRHTSLALDSSGYPHISYEDDTNDALKYAYQDGAGWHTETADSSPLVGQDTSLALDSSGSPHISHFDRGNNDLEYAYKNETGWHKETVDSAGDVGECTSLALDSNGYPHIGYYDYGNGALKYAYKNATGWHTETVDITGTAQETDTSIALDSNDYPHISYFDSVNGNLKYTYWDGGGWNITAVDTSGLVGTYTSLALDSSENPHISYCFLSANDLKYAYKNETGWHTETVATSGTVGHYTSLALDNSDYPHISYHDNTNYDLKYAYKDGAGWHIVTVDSTGITGFYTSIALDSYGYPHISYCDETNDDLKYAKKMPSVDYILITFATENEILDSLLASHFRIDCYAAAFNNAIGFLDFVNVTWSVQNSGGSNASINTTSGSSVELFSGWFDGVVTLTADDGDGHSDSVVFTVDTSVFSYMMYEGWNLMGIPFVNSWTAETLGQNISFATLVLRFNSTSQSFLTHVVGTPWDDFPIEDGVGYFVYVTMDSIFSHSGTPISSVSVPIEVEWNMISWFHVYPSLAESLGQNITGSTLVLMFDAETQAFLTHVVGTPWDNFPVERGRGVFVYATSASTWHGEG